MNIDVLMDVSSLCFVLHWLVGCDCQILLFVASAAGGSCTCRLAATDSPCGTTGGYDCTCDETDDCASAHVCGGMTV